MPDFPENFGPVVSDSKLEEFLRIYKEIENWILIRHHQELSTGQEWSKMIAEGVGDTTSSEKSKFLQF